MTLLFLIQILWADSFFCQKDFVARDFEKIESDIKTKISQAASLVTVAEQADKALSQLLATKNSVLIAWLEERKLMDASEELIASHWRHYYLQKFILGQFPTPNPKVNRSIEGLFSQINQTFFTPSVKKKISILFKKAKTNAIKQVNSWTIDEKLKKEMTLRLEKVRLYWFEKLKGTVFQNKPLDFLNKSLHYDSKSNQINVGVSVLRYPNEESLFGVFLQTLAQVFNPDRWSVFFKGQNPFALVQSCLKKNSGTNDKKQVQKIFTYWFSAEIFAKSTYLKGSLRMNLCDKSLENKNNMEQIYGIQPRIKKELSLKTTGQYCPL